MSNYRYCSECRGDDGPFLTCIKCSKKQHPECVGITLKQYQAYINTYECSFCLQYPNIAGTTTFIATTITITNTTSTTTTPITTIIKTTITITTIATNYD